jgi:DNA polymerase III subunit delta
MDALAYLSKPPAKVPPIVALVGDEVFLARRCRDAMLAKILDDADPEYALSVYPGEKSDFTTVRNDLDTLPFLAPARVVIVEDADAFVTAHRESLEKYAAKPSRVGHLILELKTLPESTKLAKALPESAKIACKGPKPESLPKWCIDWAKGTLSKALSTDAAALLVESVGPRMGLLAAELDKLAIAVGNASAITADDVDRYVARSRDANVFRILECVGDGQPAKALTTLAELFDDGDDPLAILGAMAYQLRKLAACERHLANGLAFPAAMDAAAVPKWPNIRNQFEKQVKHLGRRRLQKISDWLLEINLGLKGGSPLPGRVQVERLVVRLARPRS